MRRWLPGLVVLSAISPSSAETRHEVWPGLEAYLSGGSRTRLVLGVASVRTESQISDGRRDIQDLQLYSAFDVTLRPIVRRRLGAVLDDWERSRYLWMRISYLYGTSPGDDTAADEHRGLVDLNSRLPLPKGFWLANRSRVEGRDIGGETSSRFRDRLTLERETRIGGAVTVPYLQAEAYYDSRFDDWSRWKVDTGIEIALAARWRIEPYLSWQEDSEPRSDRLEALGVTLKFFHRRRRPPAPSPVGPELEGAHPPDLRQPGPGA
jgi:hypothetical protein